MKNYSSRKYANKESEHRSDQYKPIKESARPPVEVCRRLFELCDPTVPQERLMEAIDRLRGKPYQKEAAKRARFMAGIRQEFAQAPIPKWRYV